MPLEIGERVAHPRKGEGTIASRPQSGGALRPYEHWVDWDSGARTRVSHKHLVPLGVIRADTPRVVPSGYRLLVVDIETMANLCWSFETRKAFISPKQIVKHKRTISFAAKWVGDPRVEFFSEFHDGREVMIEAAWTMMTEADAVIGYNSKRFDVKHLNTEFAAEHLGPPDHFQQIDLYSISTREFAFSSYKLEEVAKRFGLGRKREHEGFGLWLKCEDGDEEAWSRMRSYNVQDVRLTEKLFEEFRDWIPLRGTQSAARVREMVQR